MLGFDSQTNSSNFRYNMNTTGFTNRTNDIINYANLSQNSDFYCNGSNAIFSALSKFTGMHALPTSNSGINNGTVIYWNSSGIYGETSFLNMSKTFSGGFSFYSSNNTLLLKK